MSWNLNIGSTASEPVLSTQFYAILSLIRTRRPHRTGYFCVLEHTLPAHFTSVLPLQFSPFPLYYFCALDFFLVMFAQDLCHTLLKSIFFTPLLVLKMPWSHLKHFSVSRCQKPGFCAQCAKLSRLSAPLTPSLYNLSVIITIVLVVACCFMPPCFFLLMESPRFTGKPAAPH